MHELSFSPGLLRFMQGICHPFFYRLFNIHRIDESLAQVEAPYVILGNHSDWWDPFFLMLDVTEPTHFVATEDLFSLFPYNLFIGRLGAIPKVKFLPDLDTVKSLFKARDLGRSLGIFPEGERNWDGRTLPLVPATLKLIKKLREPVVVVLLKGAHLSFPRWAYFARRGRIELEYRVVANRDEIATMGAEELIDRIRTAFAYDEHEWNR
ncbi:MAG TPA: lysophospholipid acyltransferase family protein, partial [Rectinemataceae bacterium]|nr:lysophospholipid acyltransferase family protein [Rectinemataceae bacterium]